jgi:hypothetical protein
MRGAFVQEGPAMTTPFLSFRVRGKKGALRARHHARQIAAFLHFPIEEQACIAAGAFLIACQALAIFGKFVLCFHVEDGQLHVCAREAGKKVGTPSPHNRVAALDGGDRQPILRLVKALPIDRTLAETDVAWLVRNAEEENVGLFVEIVKQNQEVLALLHQLNVMKKQAGAGPAAQSHAA